MTIISESYCCVKCDGVLSASRSSRAVSRFLVSGLHAEMFSRRFVIYVLAIIKIDIELAMSFIS